MAQDAAIDGGSMDLLERYDWRSWLVCFSAALFFFFVFIQVNMFNAISPALIHAFGVDAQQLGQISAGYFYGNLLCLFGAGLVLDRFSTRRVILVTLAFCVIGTGLFALAHSFWQAFFSRLLVGVGGAFCFLSSVRLASRWFPPRRLAFVIGLIVTLAMVGGMVAQAPLTWLTDHMGWRHALAVDAALGGLVWLLIMLVVRDAPKGMDVSAQQQHVSDLGLAASIWQVMKNPQNWLGGFYTSFLNLPIFLFGAMWGNIYLVEVHHLSRADAGLVTMMLFVGMIFGSPFFGWLSDKWRKRRPAMAVGAVIVLGLLLTIMYGQGFGLVTLMVLFAALGFAQGAQVLGYPLVAESNATSLTGTAEGMASTLIMGGGLTQPIFGWIIERHWNHQFFHSMPLYSQHSFNQALMIMPVAVVLGLVMCWLAKETHCQQLKSLK
jgi:MFS family permease